MNTLIALCIAPCGTGDEYAADVAEIVDIIRRSGLKSRTNSMFTEIESRHSSRPHKHDDTKGRCRRRYFKEITSVLSLTEKPLPVYTKSVSVCGVVLKRLKRTVC